MRPIRTIKELKALPSNTWCLYLYPTHDADLYTIVAFKHLTDWNIPKSNQHNIIADAVNLETSKIYRHFLMFKEKDGVLLQKVFELNEEEFLSHVLLHFF